MYLYLCEIYLYLSSQYIYTFAHNIYISIPLLTIYLYIVEGSATVVVNAFYDRSGHYGTLQGTLVRHGHTPNNDKQQYNKNVRYCPITHTFRLQEVDTLSNVYRL